MFFISFIEEGIFNPDYYDYVGGRIEVYDDTSEYDIEEIRFLTKDKSFYDFRERWDFKEVDKITLDEIRKEVEEKYYSQIN